MTSEVCQVRFIIDIVDLNLVDLAPLEVILHIKALDPAGAQVVHDDLCHANALPLCPCLAIEDSHSIRPRERVQVGQVLASKAQADSLHEAAGSGVYGLVDCSEDGFVEVATDART